MRPALTPWIRATFHVRVDHSAPVAGDRVKKFHSGCDFLRGVATAIAGENNITGVFQQIVAHFGAAPEFLADQLGQRVSVTRFENDSAEYGRGLAGHLNDAIGQLHLDLVFDVLFLFG